MFALTFQGLGFGLLYLPSIVAVSHYFNKRRPLATGIATCGTGIGMLAVAPLGSHMLENVGWKNAVLILGGLTLNGCVFAMMLRPLEVSPQKLSKKKSISKNDLMDIAKMEEHASFMWMGSTMSMNSAVNQKFDKNVMLRHAISRSRKNTEQTKCEIVDGEFGSSAIITTKYDSSDVQRTPNIVRKLHPHRQVSTASSNKIKYVINSVPSINEACAIAHGNPAASQMSLGYSALSSGLSLNQPLPSTKKEKFQACLNHIVDLELMKDPVFLILCGANMLAFFGPLIPFKFQVDRAMDLGIGQSQAGMLVSVTGQCEAFWYLSQVVLGMMVPVTCQCET